MRFEVVKDEKRKFPNEKIKLPERKTLYSAGYDFYSNEDYILKQNEYHIFWTDIKFYSFFNTYLQLSIRSSLSTKGLILANGVGIIDADYYNNIDNDGNIGFVLKNTSYTPYFIKKGDRIGQGIILEYKTVENDKIEDKRVGGFGSTQ